MHWNIKMIPSKPMMTQKRCTIFPYVSVAECMLDLVLGWETV